MGPNICPSTPCMVNSGTNPATVMSAEKRTALSTCLALIRISRKRSVHPWAVVGCPGTLVGSGPQNPSARCWSSPCLSFGVHLEISEDIFNKDYGGIHDDSEIDCAQ